MTDLHDVKGGPGRADHVAAPGAMMLSEFGERFPGYVLDLSGPWPEADSPTGEIWLCGFKTKRSGYRDIAVPVPGGTPSEAIDLGIRFLEEYLVREARGERVWEESVVRGMRAEFLSLRAREDDAPTSPDVQAPS